MSGHSAGMNSPAQMPFQIFRHITLHSLAGIRMVVNLIVIFRNGMIWTSYTVRNAAANCVSFSKKVMETVVGLYEMSFSRTRWATGAGWQRAAYFRLGVSSEFFRKCSWPDQPIACLLISDVSRDYSSRKAATLYFLACMTGLEERPIPSIEVYPCVFDITSKLYADRYGKTCMARDE